MITRTMYVIVCQLSRHSTCYTARVTLYTLSANKIEGELVAMDEPTGMIIIKSVHSENKEELTVLNRELLTEFEVKKYAPNNTRGKEKGLKMRRIHNFKPCAIYDTNLDFCRCVHA